MDEFGRNEEPLNDYTDEMVAQNATLSDAEFLKMLMFRFGITSKQIIDALPYADADQVTSYIVGLMLSEETLKFINYLRK